MNASEETSTVELLQQYTDFEYILLGDLGDLLEEPANSQTSMWLIAILDALLDTLPREFDLKQQEGYLAEVVEEYPTWSDQVERLRGEHDMLFGKLQRLRRNVVGQAPFAEIVGEIRRDLREWMRSLESHHRHERRLLQTALNLEVGTGD